MSDESVNILAPNETVLIGPDKEKVEVRELSWKVLKGFIQNLVPNMADFTSLDAVGNVSINLVKFAGLITNQLAEELVVLCTGKSTEWVGELRTSDMLKLVDKCVELNLRPEMIETAKKTGGRFRALRPPQTT